MTEDLSQYHQPIEDLFPTNGSTDLVQFRLSDEQVEFYRETGTSPAFVC